MRRLLGSFIVSGTLFAFACGGGGGDSEVIKAYKAIVKEGCACTDADCAKAVDKKEQDWRMSNYKGLSKDDRESMAKAREEFTSCRDKLTKGDGK